MGLEEDPVGAHVVEEIACEGGNSLSPASCLKICISASAGEDPSIAIAVMPTKTMEQRRASTNVTPMKATWWKS